jgi:hypothetical protein
MGKLPLVGVCDITCDCQGSVEFLRQFTSIEDPFNVYDVEGDRELHDMDAEGIMCPAVDRLPSECPHTRYTCDGVCACAVAIAAWRLTSSTA